MAGEIFRAGLDRHVGAALMRREKQRRRPGVVEDGAGAFAARDRGDGRNVRQLKALRAGRLEEDDAGVGPDQRLDAGADQRIEIGRLDPHPRENRIAEDARGTIDRIGDEDMVAGLDRREQGQRDRGEAGRREHRSGGARELGPGLGQRLGRRRALRAIGKMRVARDEVLIGRKQHGRAAIDRRVDETMLLRGMSAGVDELGAGLQIFAAVFGRLGHGFVLSAFCAPQTGVWMRPSSSPRRPGAGAEHRRALTPFPKDL